MIYTGYSWGHLNNAHANEGFRLEEPGNFVQTSERLE